MSIQIRRAAAILLTLFVVIAMIPTMNTGSWSHAGDGIDTEIISGVNPDHTVDAGATVSVSMAALDKEFGDFSTKFSEGKVTAEWAVADTRTKAVLKDGKFSYTIKKTDAGKELYFVTHSVNNEDTSYNRNTTYYTIHGSFIEVTGIDPNGIMHVIGSTTLSGVTFTELYADNAGDKKYYLTSLSGSSFNIDIDTADTHYARGYYMIYAKMSNGDIVAFEKTPPFAIYEKPTIKKNGNFFSTGYNYICFSPYFTVPKDSHTGEFIFGQIYFQLYDTKTKKWGGVYGPYDSYQKLKTKYFDTKVKIKANHTYKVRVFYGKNTKYSGTTYPFVGPFSNVVTIKTGKGSKPAVKSVKITKAKVKKVKLIQHAHWDISGNWHPYKEDYTYTTTYKVTVKLKKKPGTTGLIIGNKKIKGNKKTYTATFTDSGKLKGKKITVQCCTYNDSKIGAYSPVYTKKKVKVN